MAEIPRERKGREARGGATSTADRGGSVQREHGSHSRGGFMTDPSGDARVLLEAAQLNRQDPLREGSSLVFPNYGQVVMTGDLHGHRRNFEKLRRFCDLEHY